MKKSFFDRYRRARRGLMLTELVMVAVCMALLALYGGSAFVSMLRGKARIDAREAALRINRELVDRIRAAFRTRIISPPAVGSAPEIEQAYTFHFTAPLAAVAGATTPCYGLRVRRRNLTDTPNLYEVFEFKTDCVDGTGGDQAHYESMSSSGQCPAGTPRPVIHERFWYDERTLSGAPLRDDTFPSENPVQVADTMPSRPYASQICFWPRRNAVTDIPEELIFEVSTGYSLGTRDLRVAVTRIALPLQQVKTMATVGLDVFVIEDNVVEYLAPH